MKNLSGPMAKIWTIILKNVVCMTFINFQIHSKSQTLRTNTGPIKSEILVNLGLIHDFVPV